MKRRSSMCPVDPVLGRVLSAGFLLGLLCSTSSPGGEAGSEPSADPRLPDMPIACRVPPWEPRPGAVHRFAAEDQPVLAGSFSIPSRLFAHPTLRCDFLVPLDPQGRAPAPTAADVVALFPWPGRQFLRKDDQQWVWARRLGFTVFTLNFPNHAQASREDEKRYYMYPHHGAADAWNAAYMALQTIARLPMRKWFVWGDSAGASAAQLFAAARPARVEAMALFAGRTYDLQGDFLGPSLVMHCELDNVDENAALVKRLSQQGWPPLHQTYPANWEKQGTGTNWVHSLDPRAAAFGRAWITALANLRAKQGGVPPPLDRWQQVDGRRMPDRELCAPAWKALHDALQVKMDPGTAVHHVLAMPDDGKVQGTVIWLDNRFTASPHDISAAAQLVARRGYGCLALCAGGSCPPSQALSAILRSQPRLPPPVSLVMVKPASDDPLWKQLERGGYRHLLVIDAAKSDVATLALRMARMPLRSRLFIRESTGRELGALTDQTMVQTHADNLAAGAWNTAAVDALVGLMQGSSAK